MPHTSPDLLTWNKEYICYTVHAEVYIEINTDKGLQFYTGKKNMLTRVDPSLHLSSKFIRFDINCKHQKELRIIRDLFNEFNFNFVFWL